MVKVIEGSIDPQGQIKLSEELKLTEPKRVLFTILDEPPPTQASQASTDTTLLLCLISLCNDLAGQQVLRELEKYSKLFPHLTRPLTLFMFRPENKVL